MQTKINPINIGILTILSLAYQIPSFAHHPNEGVITLSTLLQEASGNNLEIKEAQKQSESVSALKKQTISGFLPQLSVDGGYQNTNLDNDKSAGMAAYGTATVNLYRGGKDSAIRDIQSKEEEFQRLRLEKTKAKIEREVSRRFYELLYFQESIALKEEALEANKKQMNLAQKKRSAGFTSQADVLEFELREATLKSDVNFLKQGEAVKERELRRLIGRMNEGVNEDPIRVSGHLERASFSKASEVLLKTALNEREDLKEAEKNLSVSELSYKSYFGDYLPRIDLEGRYGKLATDDRVFSRTNNYALILKVSIPIFSGLETIYGREFKLNEVSKNDLSASRLRQEIKVDVENALTKLKSIDERLVLEEKNIERSKQYYEITLSEYKRGVKNSPDVAGAAERHFDSRLRNLEYRKDYYVTLLETAEAVGISGSSLVKLE